MPFKRSGLLHNEQKKTISGTREYVDRLQLPPGRQRVQHYTRLHHRKTRNQSKFPSLSRPQTSNPCSETAPAQLGDNFLIDFGRMNGIHLSAPTVGTHSQQPLESCRPAALPVLSPSVPLCHCATHLPESTLETRLHALSLFLFTLSARSSFIQGNTPCSCSYRPVDSIHSAIKRVQHSIQSFLALKLILLSQCRVQRLQVVYDTRS